MESVMGRPPESKGAPELPPMAKSSSESLIGLFVLISAMPDWRAGSGACLCVESSPPAHGPRPAMDTDRLRAPSSPLHKTKNLYDCLHDNVSTDRWPLTTNGT